MSQKIIILADMANIEVSLYKQKKLQIKNWQALMTEACRELTGTEKFDAVMYMPVSQPPRDWEHKKKKWLEGKNFLVIQKNKVMKSAESYKANIDIELSIGLFKALEKQYDHIILFSGDGDFIPLFKFAEERGVQLSVASVADTADARLWKSAKQTRGKVFDIDGDSPGIEKKQYARSSKQPVRP